MWGYLHVPPIKPPTCWQYFGFNGPTNQHNLDIAYRDRINSIVPAGTDNAVYSVSVYRQYQECLQELSKQGPQRD